MSGQDLEGATIAKVTWRLMPFLLLLYIVSWIDRVNIGFAALQMNRDLGFSPARVRIRRGRVLHRLRAVRGAEQPDSRARRRAPLDRADHAHLGRAVDRDAVRRRRHELLRAALRCSASRKRDSCPGIIYYLGSWYPSAERARAVSWFMLGIPLSTVVGGPLAGRSSG